MQFWVTTPLVTVSETCNSTLLCLMQLQVSEPVIRTWYYHSYSHAINYTNPTYKLYNIYMQLGEVVVCQIKCSTLCQHITQQPMLHVMKLSNNYTLMNQQTDT